MRIKSKLLLLAVFLLALASCIPSDNGFVRDPDEFKTGTDGVEIEFVENTPPSNVREDSQFNIALDVINRGAYTADNASVNLGLERDYMCVQSGDECVANVAKTIEGLRGKTPSTPTGDYETLRFRAETKSLDAQRTRHPSTAVLTLCYEYKTELESQVCINPDTLRSERADTACYEEERTYSDQGAPIAIKKVESRTNDIGDGTVRPKFILHIENSGSGRVVDKDKVTDVCEGRTLQRGDRNVVYLKELRIGNNIYNKDGEDNDIKCRSEKIDLVNDEGRITCELKEGMSKESPAYEARIMAIFEYGYTRSYSRQIEIEK